MRGGIGRLCGLPELAKDKDTHTYNVVGKRRPRERPRFRWVNTVLASPERFIRSCGEVHA